MEAVYVATATGVAVEAVSGRGLRSDRHFVSEGQPPRDVGAELDLTPIEAEAVEAVARDFDFDFGPGEHRRNLTTRGVALNYLVGERFRVGDVRCRGVALCEPCRHLEGLTEDGAIEALVHRGGLRAAVLESGTVRVGDGLEPP